VPITVVSQLHVLRVFCDERNAAGNLLGVFAEMPAIPVDQRQEIARRLDFSETVFVDDPAQARLSIFTPSTELPFAGHPLVGAAWLLRKRYRGLSALRPPVGEVWIEDRDGLTWVLAKTEYSPPWALRELPDQEAVLSLEGPPEGLGHVQAWAWRDQQEGVIRARVFAQDYGVSEDPATGSAAVLLCAALQRRLLIIQGKAGCESEIYVQPLNDGRIALGGRVILDRPPEAYELLTDD